MNFLLIANCMRLLEIDVEDEKIESVMIKKKKKKKDNEQEEEWWWWWWDSRQSQGGGIRLVYVQRKERKTTLGLQLQRGESLYIHACIHMNIDENISLYV